MKYGLIGEKLSHSFSKEVHARLADYEYEICEIAKDKLPSFMEQKDFRAINVTIPYKEAVIPYLHYISDEAKAIGAVNTIVNRDGKLYGYNTDFFGMSSLFNYMKLSVKNKKAVILGSGGTAKTANAVLKHLGASEVITVSRQEKEGVITYEDLYSKHIDAEIIVNTTPVGMYPDNNSIPIDISKFRNLCGVVDAIYNPLRTGLVLAAKEREINAEGGLYMLVAQAVYASEIFLDTKYSTETLNDVYQSILAEKENIVLIGMPSSGKSTVGSILADKLSRPLYDTDAVIVESEGNSIPQIFQTVGKDGFRDIETRVIANISLQNGLIIATGGGAVLRKENVSKLKQNGKIFFLDRSPDNLLPTEDRPLSTTMEAMIKLYHERYPIYSAASDITVNGDNSPEDVAIEIIGGFNK